MMPIKEFTKIFERIFNLLKVIIKYFISIHNFNIQNILYNQNPINIYNYACNLK